MDQANAFHQAIVEAPADDTPRLIYADWLEEQLDRASRDLAAFIRVQYALERLPDDDPGRPQLEECQRNLILAHGQRWKSTVSRLLSPQEPSPWQALADNPAARWSFRRGFVEKVRIDPVALVRHADRIRQSAPLRELQLEPFAPGTPPGDRLATLVKLAELQLLGQLERLDLTDVAGDPDLIRVVLHSPLLNRLAHLRIDFSHQTWSILADSAHPSRLLELALSPGSHSGNWRFASEDYRHRMAPSKTLALLGETSLPQLHILSLSHWGRIPATGMELIACLDLPRLRKLELAGNDLSPEDLGTLFGAPFIDWIEELDLGHNQLGELGGRALAAAPPLARLRRLVLNSNRIGPTAVGHLATSDAFPALEALHLRTNCLGDEGLNTMMRGRLAEGLRALHLGYNRITSRGALDLADALKPGLAVLDLSWNPIGDAGARVLFALGASDLVALDLSYCQLGDATALALVNSPMAASLRTLNLGTNRLSDAGVAVLAQADHLPHVRALNLGNNPVTDAGALALLGSPLLRRLEALHLLGTNITPSMANRLGQAFRGILS